MSVQGQELLLCGAVREQENCVGNVEESGVAMRSVWEVCCCYAVWTMSRARFRAQRSQVGS